MKKPTNEKMNAVIDYLESKGCVHFGSQTLGESFVTKNSDWDFVILESEYKKIENRLHSICAQNTNNSENYGNMEFNSMVFMFTLDDYPQNNLYEKLNLIIVKEEHTLEQYKNINNLMVVFAKSEFGEILKSKDSRIKLFTHFRENYTLYFPNNITPDNYDDDIPF